jgi:hypothetical protein
VGREGIAKAALVAAWAATTCCGGGGGTPEETVETFNGHMAVKDFERAAAVVYCSDWPAAPAAEVDARRAEYAEVLAEQYDGDDLDYGRAEIEDRERISADEVEFAVLYPGRSQPAGPRATRKITVRKIGGRWYYEPAGS